MNIIIRIIVIIISQHTTIIIPILLNLLTMLMFITFIIFVFTVTLNAVIISIIFRGGSSSTSSSSPGISIVIVAGSSVDPCRCSMSVHSAREYDEVLPLQSTTATIASTPTDECSLSQRRDARKATNSDQFSRSSSRCSGWTAASPSLDSLSLSLSLSGAPRPILSLSCFRGFLPEKAARCHAAARWVLRVRRSQRRFWRAGSRRPIIC